MPYLQRSDCRLYYEDIHPEKMETIIMLHGNGEDTTYFKKQAPYFSKEYRVLLADMRGHGKSEIGQKDLNFSLFAEDIIALLDELKIKKAHVLGFSDGGSTAITLALRYPERVAALILNGANLNPRGIKTYIQLPIVFGYGILSLYVRCFHKEKAKRQVMGLMVKHPHFTLEQLREIKAETLVLVGTKDMVKSRHSRLIAAHIRHAQLTVLEGSHFIAQSNSDVYNKTVYKFLKKTCGKDSPS